MITLATLKDATAQEVFDQVVNHLLTQNRKSIHKYDFCAYRSEEGLNCAAGCLIADEEYRSDFENNTWEKLIKKFDLSRNHEFLICDLQCIHDSSNVDEWNFKLKELAEKNNLIFNGK